MSQVQLCELNIHNHTRLRLKSNALAKGGTLKAILSEVAITRAIRLSSAWAMARKPDFTTGCHRACTQRRGDSSSQKMWSHPSQRAEAAAALRHAVGEFLCCRAALLSWSKALRQSRCVPRARGRAGCFTSIRGRTGALSVGKIIESRPCTLSGNGQAA